MYYKAETSICWKTYSQSYDFSSKNHKEACAIKKPVCWGIDSFELWHWRRLWRDPWTARRSDQSILKKINPEYSLEGLKLKLKLQYFAHPTEKPGHWERPRWWERLRAGGKGNDRGWEGWMASLTQWPWVWAILGDSEGQGSSYAAVHGVEKSQTQLSDWTTTMRNYS